MASTLEVWLQIRGLFDRQPRNLRASILVISAFFTFAAMSVMLRSLNNEIPIVEVIFVRQSSALLLMAPIYRQVWPEIRKPHRMALHMMRGVTASGAMFCGLSAVMLISLADVTAIQMTEVLFATAFAALLLREKVSALHWALTLVGFAGVMIMMHPFGDGLAWGNVLALCGALCGALSMVAIRLGAPHDRALTVTFWQGLVVLCLVTPLAMVAWVTPHMEQAMLLLLMSVTFTAGQWLFTAGLRMGAAAAIAPLNYLRLIMMTVIGWLLYAETPTLTTIVGAFLILSSAFFTIRNNARGVKDSSSAVESEAF